MPVFTTSIWNNTGSPSQLDYLSPIRKEKEILFLKNIYLREREHKSVCSNVGSRGKGRKSQTPCWAPWGAWSHNPEIETWAKTKSWTFKQLATQAP